MEIANYNLLTINEMAEKLRVKKSWLYRQTKKYGPGAIPRIKVGKYLRFNESDVFEWLSKKQDEA
jgi:excisionase family DNA binding protein